MDLVDPDVTRAKVQRELELWHENAGAYRRRGWVLLAHGDRHADVGFIGRLPLGPQIVPVMGACIRVDFTNYDLWAPSVEFIDPYTGQYAPPVMQAVAETDAGPQNLIVAGHPVTGRPFFCVPGVREYHDHPQHSGDPWLLHRSKGDGRLATICDRVWRSTSRTLVGIQIELHSAPGQLQVQFGLKSAPGELAPAMWAQTEQAARVVAAMGSAPLPPQVPPPAPPSQPPEQGP